MTVKLCFSKNMKATLYPDPSLSTVTVRDMTDCNAINITLQLSPWEAGMTFYVVSLI